MASAVRKTRVCVLQCSYEHTDSCFKDLDPYCTPEVYDTENKYEWSHAYIRKATAARQVRELAQSGKVDVFLNLCDGAAEEDRAGVEVVDTLERYGCAYTGANRAFYEPSKALQKKLAYYYDVPTAPWALLMDVDMQDDVRAQQQCAQAVAGLQYPLIVKHYNGGGSIGMGRDCKVHDVTTLVGQVRKFVSEYGGALVEEFVEGREFTVLVVENMQDADHPISLTPVECIFGSGETFKHFDLKWRDYDSLRWQTVDTQAEPQLSAALRQHAAAAFVALRGTSYGRADFRVDTQGRIRFLEHNPNCGIFYPPDAMGSADYILSMDPTMNHMSFIDHIVGAALARRNAARAANTVEVVYRHQQGFGMFAARDLQPGDTIIKFEDTPHVLVSASYVRRVFGEDAVCSPPDLSHGMLNNTEQLNQQQQQQEQQQQQQQQEQQQQQQPVHAADAGGPEPFRSQQQLKEGERDEDRHVADACAQMGACAITEACGSNGGSGSGSHDGNHSRHLSLSHISMDSATRLMDDGTTSSSLSPCPSDSSLTTLTALAASASNQPAAATTAAVAPDMAAAEPTAAPGAGSGTGRGRFLEWFRAYAYPITDETWVTWSADPDQWLPLNHSCNPNAWLHGLDLVARTHINKGEQITAEYATFTVHNMTPFRCMCGASNCRGMVQGTDYLQPWVSQVYGGHVSDYVAAKRRQLKQQHQQQQRST